MMNIRGTHYVQPPGVAGFFLYDDAIWLAWLPVSTGGAPAETKASIVINPAGKHDYDYLDGDAYWRDITLITFGGRAGWQAAHRIARTLANNRDQHGIAIRGRDLEAVDSLTLGSDFRDDGAAEDEVVAAECEGIALPARDSAGPGLDQAGVRGQPSLEFPGPRA